MKKTRKMKRPRSFRTERYKISEIKDEYDELLKKKQELEEDINYLQIEYEEFRDKMKKLVVEELKSFLKKIDNGKIDLEEKSFKE